MADVPWQSWKLETCTLHVSHVYLQGDVSAIPMPMSCQKQIDTHTHKCTSHNQFVLTTPNPKICLSQDLPNCAMHKTDNSMKSPIDICWNVDKELRMDSPIHTQYLRSGGATTLILMVDGARAVNSFVAQPRHHEGRARKPRDGTSHDSTDRHCTSQEPLPHLRSSRLGTSH